MDSSLTTRNSESQPNPPSDKDAQWALVATAPDQLTAEMWQQVMLQELIPSMLDPHDAISFMGVASTPVRLMVPREMVAKAQDVLASVTGDQFLPEEDEQ